MPTPSSVYVHIGKRLKNLRSNQNLTQAQVAEIVGVSPQQYQKYEDAQSKSSVAMLISLAAYYGVSYASFLPDWDGSAPDEQTGDRKRGANGHAQSDEEDGAPGVIEDPLVSRLVTAYLQIPDQDERTRLVELVEAMKKAHHR